MSLVFVLVEPSRPANVGAAARAIKTMGFEKLVLVNSQLHLEEEARWVAHGATEILDNVTVFDSVKCLRSKYDQLIATTARERGIPRQYLSPDDLKTTLSNQMSLVNNTAVIFGRESSGLTNDELALCDLYSYIPLINDYPSLNLAQAVMVYSYTLSDINNRLTVQRTSPDAGQLHALKLRTLALLETIDAQDDVKLTQWLLGKPPVL